MPDLAIITFGADIEAAKCAAAEAILINLDACRDSGQRAGCGSRRTAPREFRGLLFAYFDVSGPRGELPRSGTFQRQGRFNRRRISLQPRVAYGYSVERMAEIAEQ